MEFWANLPDQIATSMSGSNQILMGWMAMLILFFCACHPSKKTIGSTSFLQMDSVQLSPPIFNTPSLFFEKETLLGIDLDLEGVQLEYNLQTNGISTKGIYEEPIKIQDDYFIQAVAKHPNYISSTSTQYSGIRIDNALDYTIVSATPKPDEKYTGDGFSNFSDKIKGGDYYKTKEWLGFKDQEVEMLIELAEANTNYSCIISCLISQNSWIFAPAEISIAGSIDGISFAKAEQLKITDHSSRAIEFYFPKINGTLKAHRFLKIKIKPLSKIPDWHPGAGNPAWLFIDEILIKEW